MILTKTIALMLALTTLSPAPDSLKHQLDDLVKAKAVSAALARVSEDGRDWTAALGYAVVKGKAVDLRPARAWGTGSACKALTTVFC